MSSKITTAQDIRRELAVQGYATLDDSQIEMSQELQVQWKDLCKDLLYMPRDPNNDTQRRRHARFILIPWLFTLFRHPRSDYHQSSTYNPTAGDTVRTFAPLEEHTINNGSLTELIFFDANQLPFKDEVRYRPIDVGVHFIETIATPERPGISTPNKSHKDGEWFTFIHLVNRQNIEGGDSIVCDNEMQQLSKTTLQSPLDTLVVWDHRVYHQVTEIRVKKGANQGFRRAILIDFTPLIPAIKEELDQYSHENLVETFEGPV